MEDESFPITPTPIFKYLLNPFCAMWCFLCSKVVLSKAIYNSQKDIHQKLFSINKYMQSYPYIIGFLLYPFTWYWTCFYNYFFEEEKKKFIFCKNPDQEEIPFTSCVCVFSFFKLNLVSFNNISTSIQTPQILGVLFCSIYIVFEKFAKYRTIIIVLDILLR